jgi:hypothetical protein
VEATVGYAADECGKGIAYARLTASGSERLLRLTFRVAARPLTDRAIGYAALTAVARALARRHHREVTLVLGDADFLEEIAGGRGVADGLVLSYVNLRCALNALAKFRLQSGSTDELTQRARAEATLNVAA